MGVAHLSFAQMMLLLSKVPNSENRRPDGVTMGEVNTVISCTPAWAEVPRAGVDVGHVH